MKPLLFAAFALAGALALPQAAHAQRAPTAETQALTACLTSAASEQDRVALIRWVFVAMARHPSVARYTNIPDTDRVTTNREAGALFSRLMLEDCANQTRAAFAAGGQEAVEAGFAALGEIAMEGIMSHPDVNAAVVEMTSYMDVQRLGEMLTTQ